jgi:hypothetical protein
MMKYGELEISRQAADYETQFAALDALLCQSRPLWQLRAFDCSRLPWAEAFPALAECVLALADDALDALDCSQSRLVAALLPALTRDLKAQGQSWSLELLDISLPDFSVQCETQSVLEDEGHFSAHIKGRKWQQITAFVQQLSPLTKPSGEILPYLEWCAGKGHLGRLIARVQGARVQSLEWQAQLCREGQAFADKWQLPQQFVCADAFASEVNPLQKEQHAVALHACGDLHVRLLHLGARAGTRALSVSPCCYHLIQAQHYQGLSTLATSSELVLSRHDLQLPLQQSVIASPRQQALRHQEIAWRLGFDCLQRSVRGVDAYLPLPSLRQSQLSGTFANFCLWGAAHKQLALAVDMDFDGFLQQGLKRQRLTRRLDLVAHLFRNVLEHWLLLDRVCFLTERGYRVSLGTFCPSEITPRNALIRATKT